MKTIILSAAVAAIVVGAPVAAFAGAASQDIKITGKVPTFCSVEGSTTPGAQIYTIPIDDAGVVDLTPFTYTAGNVVCNTTADIVITSKNGGVFTPSVDNLAVPTGFANALDYTAKVSFGGAQTSLNTAKHAGAGPDYHEYSPTVSTTGAKSGAMDIEVDLATPNGALMAADDYQDTVTVTLTPQ